ncbi:hypothetical protein PAXRUDRAFT_123062, partial [Paxillus rubicundulus Ve08.2h10]
LRSQMMAVGDVFPPTSLPKRPPSYTRIVFVGEYRPPSLPRSLCHASCRYAPCGKTDDRRLCVVLVEGRLPSPNIFCSHHHPCTPRLP